jgi:predicted dehydrogenase
MTPTASALHPERDRLVVSQLGCGYWGPNLARNLLATPTCELKWIADASPDRLEYIRRSFPTVAATSGWPDVIDDEEVDAVVVATPAVTHFELALAGIRAGKHVFVEKPLATSVQQCQTLLDAAEAMGVTLMVGHTFLYNPAVAMLRSLIDSGEIGEIHHLYTQRLNLGQVRADVNVLWNLAPHDFSILLHLMGNRLPARVAATGVACVQPGIEDVVFVTLEWPKGPVAHVHLSWLDPSKVRKVTVIGSSKMVVYDDMSDYKISILDKGVDRVPRVGERMDFDRPSTYQLLYRAGEVRLPSVPAAEPLQVEIEHFAECALTGSEPLTGARNGRDVVALLEAADRSIRLRGEPVELTGSLATPTVNQGSRLSGDNLE